MFASIIGGSLIQYLPNQILHHIAISTVCIYIHNIMYISYLPRAVMASSVTCTVTLTDDTLLRTKVSHTYPSVSLTMYVD